MIAPQSSLVVNHCEKGFRILDEVDLRELVKE